MSTYHKHNLMHIRDVFWAAAEEAGREGNQEREKALNDAAREIVFQIAKVEREEQI